MLWIMIIAIVAIVSFKEIIAHILKNREEMKKLELEALQTELQLEEKKYDVMKLETEKLRLELKQDLSNAPTKEDLLNVSYEKRS